MLIYVVTVSYNSPGPSLTPLIPVSVLWPAIAPLQLLVSVEPPEYNRKSGIRNRNNPRCFSSFHFSNRKFFALFHPSPRTSPRFQPPASSLQTLSGTPQLEIRISRAVSILSNFLIGTKRGFCVRRGGLRCLRPPRPRRFLHPGLFWESRAFSDHFAPNVRLRTGGVYDA